MGLVRLGIANPSANTASTILTSDNQYLVSVIATNKSTTTSANIRVWVQPSGSSTESQYAYIIYDFPIDQQNSYETFRFAVNQNDVVKIYSSTANVSFSAYGLVQYDIKLGAGISSYSASAPINPVDGMIWIDSSSAGATKPIYIYSAVSAAWISTKTSTTTVAYQSTAPSAPAAGTLWIESTTNQVKFYDGTQWENQSVPYSSIEPSNPVTGNLWVDSSAMQLKTYNGSAWVALGAAVDDRNLILAQRMFA
jgi:hypothetical protein